MTQTSPRRTLDQVASLTGRINALKADRETVIAQRRDRRGDMVRDRPSTRRDRPGRPQTLSLASPLGRHRRDVA